MKILDQTSCEQETCGNRQEPFQRGSSGARVMEIDWAESEFFQVWLKLAREGQERNRN